MRKNPPNLSAGVRRAVRASTVWAAGLILLLLVAPSGLEAQPRGRASDDSTAADIAEGARSFPFHCSGCHGPAGSGGQAPDLTAADLRHGDNDAALFQTIRFGIPGTEMGGMRFPDSRVWQVIAYLRSLRRAREPLEVPGNAARGEALFVGKGGCVACHWVKGTGGRRGPELTRIGASRSLDGLRLALLDPDRDVDPAYWQWKLVDKAGKVTTGIRLAEDTFSIRLLDSSENLVSHDKDQLQQIQRQRVSSMPSYAGTMSAAELDDLVAYLHSLR